MCTADWMGHLNTVYTVLGWKIYWWCPVVGEVSDQWACSNRIFLADRFVKRAFARGGFRFIGNYRSINWCFHGIFGYFWNVSDLGFSNFNLGYEHNSNTNILLIYQRDTWLIFDFRYQSGPKIYCISPSTTKSFQSTRALLNRNENPKF